jgi:hypothetical protein
MKTKLRQLFATNLIMLLAIALAAPVEAGDTGENRNLFKDAGAKQEGTDFKPAPDKIETNFGTLEFEYGAYPTEETAQKIYDEMDLQRATQAYMDFFPTLSAYAIVKSQIRDFKYKSSSDVAIAALPGWTPNEPHLTGNNSTVYANVGLDLKIDGPTVVECPPGMNGTADDITFKFLVDIGAVGPDKGKGGKFLFLPPGYEGTVPDGYFVVHSPSYRIWLLLRGFGEVGTGDQAVKWFKDRLKVYPLATGPREGRFFNASGYGINPLPPEDGSFFEMLNEVIQYEPAELFDKEQLGRLATLGIEKGKLFNPDERMIKIFDQAAKLGVAMSRAIVFAPRDPEVKYWPNRKWEKMFVRNTEFLRNGYNDIDARTLWHYQAIVMSPYLLSNTPGAGTYYIDVAMDKNGGHLDGAKNYRLRVPANPPVKRFWAVTAYDPTTRGLLDAGGNFNKTVGSNEKPEMNPDGSVDVYFGPKAPEGKEKNWVPTNPKKGFFLVFRFYGPLEAFIDKTWVLGDLEEIK